MIGPGAGCVESQRLRLLMPQFVAKAIITAFHQIRERCRGMDVKTTRLAIFILLAAIIGFAGTYILLNGAVFASGATGLPSGAEEGANTFRKNYATLQSIKSQLEQRKQDTGSYPKAAAFVEPDTILQGKFPPATLGGASGRFLYISPEGTDYKLIAIGTGDCFFAKTARPELVDPARSYGLVDCYGYGFWGKAEAGR